MILFPSIVVAAGSGMQSFVSTFPVVILLFFFYPAVLYDEQKDRSGIRRRPKQGC
jgi:hypothetical protein